MAEDLLWYKDAIIYELHVKAFADDNNDGVGDMKGLMQKLDYLEDLGITAIWLLPFYPSPLRDDGYDISDYYSINPTYGNVATFRKLVKEAHKRGLKVITELIINHTSDQHPWFQRARKAPKGSNHRDYYVWSDDPTKYKDARIIFTDYEPSNWSWDSEAQQYYWHRFFHHQPDLNFDNPEVQEEIAKIMDFWVEMGVDGFRLDAIPYLFERDGTNCENLPETHVFLKKLRKQVEKKKPGVMFLAEANMWPEDSVSYFGDGDECHMNYHFPIMPRLFMSLKMEDRYPIIDIIDQTPEIPENCQWAIFLRNHDELTLEMVTDEERDYMYKTYTKEAKAKINVGIRQRLAPLLENNRSKIELMNILLFSLPGTPVIYYGDEIGMGDNFYLGDRDGVRTPMQWSPDRNAGFSKANPHKLYLPVIIDPEYTYESINVETQQGNPSSLLWWMKRTLNMRKKFRAFSRGSIKFLSPQNHKVLSFVRSFEDENLLVVINLSRYSQAVDLDLDEFHGQRLVEVFSQNPFPSIKTEHYPLTLSPYGYFWFIFEPEESNSFSEQDLPKLDLQNWSDLQKSATKKALQQEILPKYLKKTHWFNRYKRKVQSIEIMRTLDISGKEQNAALLLLEVSFPDGLPEKYIINLVFGLAYDTEAHEEMDERAAVAKSSLNGKNGYLLSGEFSRDFMMRFFRSFLKSKKSQNKPETIYFHSALSKASIKDASALSARQYRAEGYNSTINISDQYLIKLYRQVDDTVNPDVEINSFLSSETSFQNVAQFLGSAEINDAKFGKMPFAMLQKYVPHQGTAWTYLTEAFKSFYDVLSVKLHQEDFDNSKRKSSKFDKLGEEWDDLFQGDLVEQISLLGQRTGELHLALSSSSLKDFKPEEFSLHYQRSLYSGFKTTIRTAMQTLEKNLKEMDEVTAEKAKSLLSEEKHLQEILKRIYRHKFSCMKIRNHGDMILSNILWMGNDFIFVDFEGEDLKPFSERRIKRSPLRDLAVLQRSIHYAAYESLVQYKFSQFDDERLPQWADRLYQTLSAVLADAYFAVVKGSSIIPDNKEDLEILHTTFLMERMLFEVKMQPYGDNWWAVPVHALENIVKPTK